MTGAAVIVALLKASAPLIAAVPVARLYSGVIAVGTPVPALGVSEVSTVEAPTIDAQSPTTLVNALVQVTVMAKDYPQQKQVLALVRKACNYQRGDIAGVRVVSVRREGNGPDFSGDAAGLYMQSVDFRVVYHEPN